MSNITNLDKNQINYFGLIIISFLIPMILILFFRNFNYQYNTLFLLLFFSILGYLHFLIGFYYQYTSQVKKANKKFKFTFMTITILSMITYYYLVNTYNPQIIILLAALLFLFHGHLNEKFFFKNQLKKKMDSFAIFTMSYILIIILINIFLINILKFQAEKMFGILSYFLAIYFIMWIFIIYNFIKKKNKNSLILNLIAFVVSSIVLLFQFSYYEILTLYLSYHFIRYGIYFHFKFRSKEFLKKEKIRYQKSTEYNKLNMYLLGTILIFITIKFSFNINIIDKIYFLAFSDKYFLLVSTMHIFSSFFNEEWIIKLLK